MAASSASVGYLSSMLKPSQAGVRWNASLSVAILLAAAMGFIHLEHSPAAWFCNPEP